MKAIILAAGEGRRMRPLTRYLPKPLLKLNNKTLIDRHVERLQEAGFSEVVINLRYLGEMIKVHFQGRTDLDIEITFSEEIELLETAGGIKNALPVLGEQPFAVVSSDIYTDYNFSCLLNKDIVQTAHLVMVDNPEHHAGGDFSIASSGLLDFQGNKLTWAGIGIFTPDFFSVVGSGMCKLRTLFDIAIPRGEISAEHYDGFWTDVGTPERLEQLQKLL